MIGDRPTGPPRPTGPTLAVAVLAAMLAATAGSRASEVPPEWPSADATPTALAQAGPPALPGSGSPDGSIAPPASAARGDPLAQLRPPSSLPPSPSSFPPSPSSFPPSPSPLAPSPASAADEPPLPGAASFPPPPAGVPSAVSAPMPGQRGAPPADGWTWAPMRVWGEVGYELRRERVEGFPVQTRHLVSTGINVATYLWEPWFAVLTGGLKLTGSTLDQTGASSDDRFVTGYARLNLLPLSRFPFEARFDRSDSRIDSDLGGAFGYVGTHWGATQRYRTPDNAAQVSLAYDQFEQDSAQFGRDVQRLLQIDATTTLRQRHQLAMLGTISRNERVSTGDETLYDTFALRHTYAPDSGFSWDNSANATRTSTRFSGRETALRFAQASSVAFWRPTSRPLTLSASARAFTLVDDATEGAARSSSLNGSLGAAYAYSRNLSFNGGVSATRAQSAADSRSLATSQVGATWNSDARAVLGDAQYTWFAAGSLIASHGTAATDGLTGTTQLGHTLLKNVPLEGSTLSLTASQALAFFEGALTDSTTQVAHSAAATWTAFGERSSGFLRLNAADSRFLDGSKEVFQLVNAQGTFNHDASRTTQWVGNVTVQATRSSRDEPLAGLVQDRWVPTSSADLTFSRRRVFDVPRLTFQSQLRVLRTELVQPIGPPEDREARSWENRLDWLVGRLESRVALRLSEVDGRGRWLLMWRLLRRFGA